MRRLSVAWHCARTARELRRRMYLGGAVLRDLAIEMMQVSNRAARNPKTSRAGVNDHPRRVKSRHRSTLPDSDRLDCAGCRRNERMEIDRQRTRKSRNGAPGIESACLPHPAEV